MKQRDIQLKKLKNEVFDVLIIGGGINGASSAASLSARGLKVALIDQNDFASMTSQESSNMVWGGIKYLENFEFYSLNYTLWIIRHHLPNPRFFVSMSLYSFSLPSGSSCSQPISSSQEPDPFLPVWKIQPKGGEYQFFSKYC